MRQDPVHPGRDAGTPRQQALSVAGGYALTAGLWIFFSDRAIDGLGLASGAHAWAQTAKGWGFVAFTALSLYLLLYRLLRHRARLAADLHASERLFHDTFRHAAVGLAHVAPGGQFLRVNPQLCTILGYTGEQLLERSFQQLTHPDDVDNDLVQRQRLLDGEIDSYSSENRYLRADGSPLWAQLTVALVREARGRPDYLITALEPITERKRIEAELRENEARYRSLIEHAPDAIFVSDGKRVMLVNRACLALFGAERPAQLLGKSAFELFHRDDHAALRARIQQLREYAAPVPPRAERIVCLDGSSRAVEVSAASFDDGPRHLFHVILRDISERTHIEQALHQARNEFAALFTAAPLAIVKLDPQVRVRLWNPAAERLFGCSASEALGQLPPYMSETMLPELHALAARVIAGESLTGVRVRRLHRTGTPLELSLSTAPTRGANGVIDGILVVFEEVGDRVRAETEVQALNATLERRVAERTRGLEAANHELDAFVHTVAHDLKAPLRGIDGYSRLLQESGAEQLGSEAGELLARIRANAQQMHRLIEDLLAYARLDRHPSALRPLDLAGLVEALLAELRATDAVGGAEITLAGTRVTVLADADDLALVLRQLLDNALKFSRAATPPRIEIGARNEPQRVVLWIRDNGIGFDMRYHEAIFEMFQHLERQEEYPGTGIGLALVRKALQRMGGRVWAESRPGDGAVFYVELPSEPDTTP
jgi:PAS domain S-box-containing protein